ARALAPVLPLLGLLAGGSVLEGAGSEAPLPRAVGPQGIRAPTPEPAANPGPRGPSSPGGAPPPAPLPAGPPPRPGFDKQAPPQLFSLPEAVAFGLENSPRLRAAYAATERAQGQEQVAFAPFLPQIDYLSHTGVTSLDLGPTPLGATG